MTGPPPEAEEFFCQKISRNEHLGLGLLGWEKRICGGPDYSLLNQTTGICHPSGVGHKELNSASTLQNQFDHVAAGVFSFHETMDLFWFLCFSGTTGRPWRRGPLAHPTPAPPPSIPVHPSPPPAPFPAQPHRVPAPMIPPTHRSEGLTNPGPSRALQCRRRGWGSGDGR